MKKIYAIMGASIAAFACLLLVNAHSELAGANASSTAGIAMLPPEDSPKIDDIAVKNAGGKFVYKEADSSDASEQVSVKGEFPTGVTDFRDVSYIAFSSYQAGKQVDAVSDGFSITPDCSNADGTKLKKKLFFWSKSSGHAFPSWCTIQGKLKDNKMSFTYTVGIKPGVNSGQLQELEDYDRVRNTMQTMKSYKTSAVVQTSISVTSSKGVENHYDTSQGSINAKKTAASAKLIKP